MTEKQIRSMEVFPYDPTWKDKYELEAHKLLKVFSDEVINIFHIGSTAIPGIYAKPVIDIMIEVRNISIIDSYNPAMEALNYLCRGESGIIGRRYFLKGLVHRTHHVHIFETGNKEVNKHLNFRDYMIAHPDKAKSYEILKRDLSEKFKHDPLGYVNGKNAFIQEIDKKASEWARNR